MAIAAAEQPPRSVVNLHHQAQISHRGVATAPELLAAMKRPDVPAHRKIAAQALQEAEIPEVADLLVDRVLSGLELHKMLSSLAQEGAIRRPDLVDWSARFA